MSILTRSAHEPSRRDRLVEYCARLVDSHDFDPLYHGARVERGRKVQAEIIRLPVPRHRSLVVIDETN